jgi:hypothetical protein
LSQKSGREEKSLKNIMVVLEQKERVKLLLFSAVNYTVDFVLSNGKEKTIRMP